MTLIRNSYLSCIKNTLIIVNIKPIQKLCVCLLTMIMVTGCPDYQMARLRQQGIDAAIQGKQQFDAENQARRDANDKGIQEILQAQANEAAIKAQDDKESAKAHFVEAQRLSSQGLNGNASLEFSQARQLDPTYSFATPEEMQNLQRSLVSDAPRNTNLPRQKREPCLLQAYTFEMASVGRDIGYTPKQTLGLVVNAKNEQEWKIKIDDLKQDGVSLAWMKEAINQVYFDPRFINARGNGFFMQMLNLCAFGPRRYEPLK